MLKVLGNSLKTQNLLQQQWCRKKVEQRPGRSLWRMGGSNSYLLSKCLVHAVNGETGFEGLSGFAEVILLVGFGEGGALNYNRGEGDPENHIEELGGKPGK